MEPYQLKLSCTKTSRLPTRVSAQASLSVSPQVSCDLSSPFEARLIELVSKSVCLYGTRCTITADVTRCGNRKRRQISEEESEITFTFNFDFDSETDSGNSNITEYTIEDSLSPFSKNSGDWLAVEIDGVTYVADTSNITKGASLECNTGYFLQDEHDICVGCSPGTMYDAGNGYCISCPLGTYQELAARNWCVPCPEGYTTNATGSYDQNDCYYDSDVITGAVVGSCVFAVLVALSVVAIVKIKRTHLKNKIHNSAFDLHEDKNEGNEKMSRNKSTASIQTTSNIPISILDKFE